MYKEYIQTTYTSQIDTFHFLLQELFALIYWRIKYLKLKYGLSLPKIHEKYNFRIIFYVSLIKNDKHEGMYKEYIQTTYTSQIDKNIIRTENKMKTNYLPVTRIADAIHILKVLIGDQNTRTGCKMTLVYSAWRFPVWT
jgi:hypothetical protein